MPAATIATIDTISLRLPLDTWAPPPQFAGRPRTHVDMLLVRVATLMRDVREGRDGSLYLVTDEDRGELWRISPRR